MTRSRWLKYIILVSGLIGAGCLVAYLDRQSRPMDQKENLEHWLGFWNAHSGTPKQIEEAKEAIRKGGTNNIPFILAELKASRPRLFLGLPAAQRRARAVWALEVLGPEALVALPHVTKLLHHPNREVRASAIEVLYNFGSEGVNGLAIAVRDRDHDNQYQAIKFLGLLGGKAEGATNALITAMQNTTSEIAYSAARTLIDVASDHQALVAAFLSSLGSSNSSTRGAAAYGLGLLKINRADVVKALVELTKDHDIEVQASAARALAKITNSPSAN